jgi:hypothetical protein
VKRIGVIFVRTGSHRARPEPQRRRASPPCSVGDCPPGSGRDGMFSARVRPRVQRAAQSRGHDVDAGRHGDRPLGGGGMGPRPLPRKPLRRRSRRALRGPEAPPSRQTARPPAPEAPLVGRAAPRPGPEGASQRELSRPLRPAAACRVTTDKGASGVRLRPLRQRPPPSGPARRRCRPRRARLRQRTGPPCRRLPFLSDLHRSAVGDRPPGSGQAAGHTPPPPTRSGPPTLRRSAKYFLP